MNQHEENESFSKKPFSMEFKLIHTFGKTGKMGSQPNQFKLPSDVKISYKHQCILISDTSNKRIQVFDWESKEFKVAINVKARPQHLCIERNYNGCDDEALYFSCGDTSCVFKYDLKTVIENSMKNEPLGSFIWKSIKLNNPQGIGISYSKTNNQSEDNLVFVGELGTGRMRVVKALSGEDTESSEFRYKCRPYYMSFTSDSNDFVVTEPVFEDRVQMFHKNESGEWISMCKFGKKGSGDLEFQNPYGIVYDEVLKHIIVADSFNNRIQIFDLSSTLVKSFGKRGQGEDDLCAPNGMFMDHVKGELYVCDFANQRVQIYQ